MPPQRQNPSQALSGARSALGLERLSSPPRGPLLVGLAVVAMLGIYLATRLSFLHRFPYFVDEAQYAYYTDRAAHSYTTCSSPTRLGASRSSYGSGSRS